MRTLVTGGTGFIGRALTARLAADRDNEVAVLARDAYRHQPLPPPLEHLGDRLVTLYGDLRDFPATRRALAAFQPEVIFHLAAGGVSEPFLPVDEALEHNLTTLLNLLRAACETDAGAPPGQVVVVRTPGEVSAMNPYAASKAAAWSFCRMYARTRGWPICGAMPFQTYGPGQGAQYLVSGAVAAALAGDDFPLTAGTQARDWIYVSDVVDGLIAVRDTKLAPGTSVDLGTGRLTSVAEVVSQVSDLVGGSGRPLVGALPSRSGEDSEQRADVRRTQHLIGWQAAVSLGDGLARTLEAARRSDT